MFPPSPSAWAENAHSSTVSSPSLRCERGVCGATRTSEPALINGAVGAVSLRDGKPFSIGAITVKNGKIVEMDFFADPERLARLDLTILED